MRAPAWASRHPSRRRALVGRGGEGLAQRRGRTIAKLAEPIAGDTRLLATKVFLAAAYVDHDPGNNRLQNLKAFCQRCHMLHDRVEHQRRRRTTLWRRKALGDLFQLTISSHLRLSSMGLAVWCYRGHPVSCRPSTLAHGATILDCHAYQYVAVQTRANTRVFSFTALSKWM